MLSNLPTKTVLADRFEIDRVAGSGGMGVVYRALDRHTSEWVALKVLHKTSGSLLGARRFTREARILSELHHPGIVSHVASGQTRDGLNYLVMEWLEGEDLAQRMNRGALSVYEARQLLLLVGAALAFLHQRNIVHRDIKPSNLFLCNQKFDRVVLLDFGVALHDEPLTQSALTTVGTLIGTLEYMAPEQARAEEAVTAAADMYSLGRVVYQGLFGQKRRASEHVAAALARALFEEFPPLAQVCPWIPQPLSDLVSRMLAKDASQRPADGAALLGELTALGSLPDMDVVTNEEGRPIGSDPSLTQSLYTVILAVPSESAALGVSKTGESLRQAMEVRHVLDATLINHEVSPKWLVDGSLLLVMARSEAAQDQALRAARCALIIKARWPDTVVAVTTGQGHLAQQDLIGEVVDRAARLLRERQLVTLHNPRVAAIAPGSVWLDELSASLLAGRFAIFPFRGAVLLTGEATSSEDARSVLGTLPPCIGREEELTLLDALLNRCRDDSAPQAVLITAAPGVGKTRLCQEFVNRLRRRSRVWSVMHGAGEILSAGSPYALLGQALRRLCAIESGAPPDVAHQRLTRCCIEFLGPQEGPRVALFLGEICGVAYPGGDPPEMRAVRGDASAFSAYLIQAFTAFLGACCDRSPVVLVLDALQWGDAQSIRFVEKALLEMKGRPFMVVALGRPEVKTTFPKVLQWSHVKNLPLDGLSRGASERLVHFVLGNTIASSVVARIVQHAAGNALFLEELIRAESEHPGRESAETVLAVLQARMRRLEKPARMVLDQASIFGQRFWRGGLLTILEAAQGALDVAAVLKSLEQAELITQHQKSCFQDDCEYSFRHPLMQEAAYSLLLDDQKRRLHRGAGEYLERVGELQALVLAEHFRRSDEPSRAVPYFTRVAMVALDGNEASGALTWVQHGLACMGAGSSANDADRATRGELLAIRATALYRSDEMEASRTAGEEALRLLPPGRVHWWKTLEALLIAASLMGQQDPLGSLVGQFMAQEPSPEAVATYLETGGILVSLLSLSGQRLAGRTMLSRMESLAAGALEKDPAVKAWLRYGQHRIARWLEGDPWGAWRHGQEAESAATQTGNGRWMGVMQEAKASAGLALGLPAAEGAAMLRAARKTLSALGEEVSQDFVAVNEALLLSTQAAHAEEAAKLAHAVLGRKKANALASGMARWALSRIDAVAGLAEDAETEARAALLALKAMPPMRIGVFAQLIRVLLSAGRLDAARDVAEEGMAALQALDGVGFMDQSLRLAVIEVRRAADDLEGAASVLRIALSALRERAARIPDPMWRQRYLENVVENAKLRALGRELLNEEVE